MKVLVVQSCPTLCNPMNCSSPDFFVLGILQAKILEWVVISFFNSTANSDNCYVAAWVWGKCGEEWIHVDVWLSPFLVHLKLSQHCLFIGYSPIQNNCLKFVFKRRNLAVVPALSWVLTYIQCTIIFFFFFESHSVMSDSLQPHGLYSPRNSPGQDTGVGSCSLLQGIFPTQGSNPGLPHCR